MIAGLLLLGLGACEEAGAERTASLIPSEVAAAASPDLDVRVGTQGEPCVADFDNDGDADLIVPAHNRAEWPILRNEGNGAYSHWFTLPIADRHGCDAADVNGDGLLDFYAVIGAHQGTSEVAGLDELWVQRADGSGFDNQVVGSGAEDGAGRGREVLFLDSNGDASPDLFVGNEIGVDFPSPNRHYLGVSGGDASLAEDSGSGLGAEIGATCSARGDVDQDGLEDLLLCASERIYLDRQSPRGVYTDVAADLGLADLHLRDAELADVNADGWLDLLGVTAQELSVRLNRAGRFPETDHAAALVHGRDVAMGDANGDGDMDIFLVEGVNRDHDRPDSLFLGDGSGDTFHRLNLPDDANEGEGDTVTVLPSWKESAKSAFLVTNGKWPLEGRYRLWEFADAE